MTGCRVLLGLAGACLAAWAAWAAAPPPAGKRSGYDEASPEVRAMQDDELGPGALWVAQGAALWEAPAGPAGRSCAGCHGTAESSMRGVAARYPAWDAGAGRVLSLGTRIAQCRTERQEAPPHDPEGADALALEAYVGSQSRGLPLHVEVGGAARPTFELGQAVFTTRMGQLNLACSQCHDTLAGERLAGSRIPQGHPTGYPLYRLEWQTLGSLYRRIRNCMTGVRAEPFPRDAPEVAALELYLAWRAEGLSVETPAVRP